MASLTLHNRRFASSALNNAPQSQLSSDDDLRGHYQRYAKPRLADALASLGLDVVYKKAIGDKMYYESDGKTIEVLDLLGGFGAGLLGHHHPELVEIARANLDDCLPSHAQASCRGWAALLCRKLSKMLSASVGGDYVVHLLNSGTEAVEAAVRHCELARRDQFDQALALAESSWLQFDAAIASFSVQERAALVEDWQGAMPPEVADLAIEQWANWALSENRNAAETEPCFLAFESSYHGSGSAASKLSHGKRFRSALSLTGIDVHFVDPYAPSELEAYLQKISLSLWKIRFNGDERWHLQEVKQSRASALFAEVIQGEGGIRVLPVECLSEMAKICRSHSVPWVADEIQTGLGRTGQFLATESVGVRPSMVLLSKILGGGLAKISAMAVQRRFYVEDFSMQHSSTFSEDDPSSKIAIGVLEILERDDFALIQRGAELGDRFSSGLEALKKKWPHVIADVRGKGLMLGIEFAQQSANPSALIRGFDASGSLAAIATGWLLRAERVRLAPALRHPRTLRIQPSLMIDESGIQHALSAIDRFCRFIAQGDALRLTSFLHGQQFPADESQLGSIEPFVAPVRDLSRGTPYAALYHEPRTVLPRVAFMCHFINPSSVKKWDLSLSPLTTKAAGDLLYRMEGWASYYPLYRFRVKSITGQEVDAVLIGWPIMPRTYLKALRSRPLHRRFTADIREALHDASEEGCTVAGFGGFTSILTHACKDVCNDEIRVTSGNSLTVGMAARALEKGCREQALVMGDETAVILGAAGNLGRIQAELIHEKMGQLLLLGTEGSEARLQLVADELMALHPDAPLPRVSTNVDDIHGCRVLVAASNSPEPIVGPEHLVDGPTVFLDVSVPGDAMPGLESDRPSLLYIRGGVVQLPHGDEAESVLELPGWHLPDGHAYACLAETLLLGLEGIDENFSCGEVSAESVFRILQLADKHGFVLGDYQKRASI